MMALDLGAVKRNPALAFGTVIVVGLLLWVFVGRGAGGSSGATYVTGAAGPSDAQVAAGAQIQMAQIQANAVNAQGQMQIALATLQGERDLDMAGIQATIAGAEIAAAERANNATNEASIAALALQLNAQTAMTESNNSFALDYARIAADSATDAIAINAHLTSTLSGQQLEAYKYGIDANIKQTMLSVVPTLKKKDRDETLQILGSNILGNPVNFYNGFGPATIFKNNAAIGTGQTGLY